MSDQEQVDNEFQMIILGSVAAEMDQLCETVIYYEALARDLVANGGDPEEIPHAVQQALVEIGKVPPLAYPNVIMCMADIINATRDQMNQIVQVLGGARDCIEITHRIVARYPSLGDVRQNLADVLEVIDDKIQRREA